MKLKLSARILLTLCLGVSLKAPAAEPGDGTVYESAGQKFRVEKVAEYDDVVWGFDFLPDKRIVLTGRDSGTVSILDPQSGKFTKLGGAPATDTPSQGGMLDVRVLPGSANPAKIYLTYTPRNSSGQVGTALGSGTINGDRIAGFRQIFAVQPGVRNGNQFGSRIEFDGQGHVFITTGDHGDRNKAQSLESNIGKVIRLNLDGSVPADNPYASSSRYKKEIWALGLRSPEGLAFNPTTGDLWEAEMGPLGGDEVNLIKKGANYGWPVITWGLEYSGKPVGQGLHEKQGMEQPIVYWLHTEENYHITPAALAFYTGDLFPSWKGNAFIGTLATTHLHRLVLRGNQVVEQEELLKDLQLRIRNVRTGPDGYLYFSSDSGVIARIVPVN